MKKRMFQIACLCAAAVAAAEPFRLPVPMVWQVNFDTLSRRQYLKDVDYLRANTIADVLLLAPVEGVMPEDTDQFHDPVKELVEYARTRGFRVILRASPKTKGFFSLGAYSGKNGIPILGPLPCILEDQSKAQALTVDVEGTLDVDGFIALESTAKWNRDKILPLYAKPLRAWSFDPVGDDAYRAGSLEDVTKHVRIVYRDNRTMRVELDLGAKYAGKRVFLLAAHYFNCYELYEGSDMWFRKLFDSLADVPLSGAANDEFGYMAVNVWDGPTFRGRFWSEAAERHWREALGTDYARLLFDMRRTPDNDRSMRVKAFNRYWDEFRRVPVECERKVAEYQMSHHVDPFLACHSTYHNSLDSDDIVHNACDYWTVPRDYAFTDEGMIWPIRLGVLAASREKFGYNMYYSKNPEAVYGNIVGCAPFKFREFHHAYNDGKWGLAYKEEPFVTNVRRLDTEIAKLDQFQKGVMPRMDVLAVFGEFAHFNWLPDGEKARSKWDVNGSLKVMDKVSEMWKAGYRCALVPDRLIEEGRMTFKDGKFLVHPGKAWASKEPDTPVAFDRCVFLYPRYAKKATWNFLNGAAAKGAALAVVGPADVDFDGAAASFKGRHFANWSMGVLSALGCGKSGIPGGAVYDDGSFALVSRGILDGKPTAFDFTVDGVRYTGRHTGILAYRQGQPLLMTPGGELRQERAKVLSTGVQIPAGGVPMNGGGHQYTTRTERRPAAITNETAYLKWKWRMNLANPETGLDNDALRAGVVKIARESGWKDGKEDWYDVSARCFDFLVDNVAIGFSKYDGFPAISAWDRHSRPMSAILWSHSAAVDAKYSPGLGKEIGRMAREGRATIGKDFDHSAPDWIDILKLGFPGMKARADSYAQDTPFYRAEKKAAAAMMRFLDRLIATAKAHPDAGSPWMKKEIASLERLRIGPPQTVFDVMEFTMVYFILSEPLNYFQVRTFDNIDVRWWPYYQADLAAGRTTEAEFREDLRHFLWQFGSIDNYWGHPIYLGGTNKDGTTAYNPLSLIILDVVEKTALPTPKFQLKMAKNTPDEIWWKALDMLRKHAPLCLMSEESMARSMKPVGLTDEECRDLLIWGCFEYLPRAKGNCTSATHLNMAQPVVEIMSNAAEGRFSAATFEDFKREYFRILHGNTDLSVELLREMERHLAETNPALMLSLAVGSALEKGVDAFSLGYKYNFTAIAECGFATAVDSLLAVKEFVYDKKAVSLQELGRILAADWKGHEELRLRMKNSKLKWGCGNPEADALAKEVVEGFTSRFVGKPNTRGGKFVCYGINSRGFINEGQRTGATPDGRKKGDHLSKNMAPSVGAETEGITGSISSYGAIAPENFPCGSIYDVMIHPSTVAGDKGLRVFRALVEQFFAGGGVAMNINIVSPETLRDAQAHPEKYENLQVRVAGWNIRWNDIPRKEQDEYIARIETVGCGM